MKLLTKDLLPEVSVDYFDSSALPEKVLQFGEGNFLRAFVNWMFDAMNRAGKFNGRAVVVQPIDRGMVDMVNDQDGLYTLLLRGIENGEVQQQKRIISSISRGLNPYADWAGYLETARNPEMEVVVSNTTEAGIVHTPEAFEEGKCPNTFPAKVTAWLNERFKTFSGAADKGVVFLPCELINYNGTKLKECVLKYAADWSLGVEFVAWVENACIFLSTLVDRIVPGYPREEIEGILEDLGYEDRIVDTGEIFHLFVIEGDEAAKAKLPLCEVDGLNIVWTQDMQPYRNRKVSILNGAHTSSVLAAFLGGVEAVREMVEDEDFGAYIKKNVYDEIVPALDMDEEEKKQFAAAVMERFLNPFIKHELISISLNSVSKWKVRVLPSVKSYCAKECKVPQGLAFSLAALIAFYKCKAKDDGSYYGVANGAEYPVRDDKEIMEYFADAWERLEVDDLVREVLGKTEFWGEDLNDIRAFTEFVTNCLQFITENGMREAVKKIIKK